MVTNETIAKFEVSTMMIQVLVLRFVMTSCQIIVYMASFVSNDLYNIP